MHVQQDKTTFPYSVQFLRGARAAASGPQVLGALVAKQALKADGALDTPQSARVLLGDEVYNPDAPEDQERLVKLESDVVVYKPRLDVVVVGAGFSVADFGLLEVTRGSAVTEIEPMRYGWRRRSEQENDPVGDPDGDRRDWAGNAGGFVPDAENPYKLPAGFDNRFFSGRRPETTVGAPLVAGNQVHLQAQAPDTTGINRTWTIPQGPRLAFTRDCWAVAPPAMLYQGVDTVALLTESTRLLLTWRFVFVWEERLSLATLEVR